MLFASFFAVICVAQLASSQTVYVSNLDATCLRCLCHAATGCDESYGCSKEGFCGPFFISRKYWSNAGSLKLNSNYASDGGFESCVRNYFCASQVVATYMSYNAWDCNGDGVTDCDDYARIHYQGPDRCTEPEDTYSQFFRNYSTCRPPRASDEFSV